MGLRKKLVITATTFPRWRNDKVPHFVFDYAKEMKKYFGEVVVIAPHYKGAKQKEIIDGVFVRRFRYFWPDSLENITYEEHASNKVSRNPIYVVKLCLFVVSQSVNLLREARRADVVNAHWLIPQGFIAVILKPFFKARVVVTVHGGDVYTLNAKVLQKIKKFVLKRADTVVVNSSATEKKCKELYPGRDYKIIPMGTDIDRFKDAKIPQKADSMFTTIFVGRLSREKGVKYLLEAAKLVKENIKVLIVGDGPQRASLEKFVTENNLRNVVFMGWVSSERLPSILKTADVFVGPSTEDDKGSQEAFGLVFVEAAAAGLPVIATNTGGIKDIVKNEETGFLVEQRSPEQLAQKIELLSKNHGLREQMGKKAQSAVRRYSWELIGKSYNQSL